MEENPDLSLHVLTSADLHDVMKLLERTFFSREPILKAYGCSMEDMVMGMSTLLQEALQYGVCVGLRAKTTKDLIAVKISTVETRSRNSLAKIQISRKAKMVAAVSKSLPPPVTLFEDPQLKKILYGRITNVDPAYSGRNLSNILHEVTEKIAIEQGCQVFYSQVANKTLLKTMIERGCKVIHTNSLSDVSGDDEPIIRKPNYSDADSISAIVKILIPGSFQIKSSL